MVYNLESKKLKKNRKIISSLVYCSLAYHRIGTRMIKGGAKSNIFLFNKTIYY